MVSFKVGDLVAIKEKHLMQGEDQTIGTIVADATSLKFYTPEHCDALGYEHPRKGWWSVLWSRGVDAGKVSDCDEKILEWIAGPTVSVATLR